MDKVREAVRAEFERVRIPDEWYPAEWSAFIDDVADAALSALPAPESGCEAAVLAERERCARIAERIASKAWSDHAANLPLMNADNRTAFHTHQATCAGVASAIRAPDGREG